MPEYLYDGSTDFLGGQDASKVPDRIPPNAYAAGVNVSTRRGVLSPRTGIDRKSIVFNTGELELPNKYMRSYEDIFRSGNYQARIPYGIGTDSYLIIIIAGIIYLFNQNTLEITTIGIEDGSKLDESAPRINWSLAGKFVVIFDFPARPVIIDGTEARRSNPDDYEVPISRLGAYNQNRLFIVNDGNEFTAGDPTGSAIKPDAPITFEEVLAPAAPFIGQIFQLPTDLINAGSNDITAAAFLQFTDTSTGIGPLLLSTKKAIYSFQSQAPRTSWQTTQFGTALTDNAGIAGARAFVNVNSDLFFMSADGQIRTLSMSREEQRRWSKVPISKEVENWIKFYDKSLVKYSVMEYFNNRIMIAVNPYRTRAKTQAGFDTWDVTHAGYVVIELDSLSTLSAQSPPVWAGLWTGVRPMDFCINNDRCFIISKDNAFRNEIYEIDPSLTYDKSDQKSRNIRSKVYFREYAFQSEFQDKSLHSLDISLASVKGRLDISTKFKPAHASKFKLWREYAYNAITETCKVPRDDQVNGFVAQDIGSVNLGGPEDALACDEASQLVYQRFRKVQLLFEIVGKYWELHEFRIKAIIMPQSETARIACEMAEPVEVLAECNDDWLYEEL